MAITSVDALIAGLKPPQPLLKASFTGQAAGQFHSSFYLAGLPGAAAAPSPGIAGAALTTYAGQITFPAAVAAQSVYLAGIDAMQGGNVGAVMLCDRLWHNSGITVTTTTSQTVNSVAFPARDLNGTINGAGIQVAIEVTTATTNGSPVTNTTMSYTDSQGNAGNTATIASFPATAVAGTLVPFNLAAGDVGVQSIQSVTLGTSYGGGAISLVAYRVLAVVPTPTSNVSSLLDYAQVRMPQVFDNSVPWLVYLLSGTAGGQVIANVSWAQG